MKDDQFHPIRDIKGTRKSRDQSTKQQGLRIRKRMIVQDNPHAKVPTESIFEGDNESLYKVKDVIAEPMTTRKYPRNIYIHITNMEEATGEKQPEGKKFYGEVLMVPQWRYIHPEIKKDIAESAGFTLKEFEKNTDTDNGYRWVFDLILHSGGIRLGQDETGADPDELRQRLANKTPAYAGMIGFFLDEAWNRIGTTGWDSLNHLTKNKDLFGGKP